MLFKGIMFVTAVMAVHAQHVMICTGDSAASPLQDALRPRTAQILDHALSLSAIL